MSELTEQTLELKILSSLEKVFLDESLDSHPQTTSFVGFCNQRIPFQIGLCRRKKQPHKGTYRLRFSGSLADHARLRVVTSVASPFPCAPTADSNYLRRTVGLYPELLRPLHYADSIRMVTDQPQCVWVDLVPDPLLPAGMHTLSVEVTENDCVCATEKIEVRILEQQLPPQKLIHTEWFYTDCIANAYRTRAFSERHWKLIEQYLKTAVENGINMILTPVFTPELDTYIGGERLTTQLLDITVEAPNVYRFGFEKLDRWVDLCQKVGVEYYEIPHFFTQWGAEHAPKFIATVNGKKKQIFGWDTDACGEEYKHFLSELITALVAYFEKRGIASRCFFHVSDEPRLDQLDQYRRCKDSIAPYLKEYPIIDALSDYAFYESGILEKPVPEIKHIRPFLENKVQGLWTYYCGDSGYNVTGRQFAMSLARTRILGLQLYLADIEGFLHWGYNYYNNQNSYESLDPFLFSDGEYFVPSGDACLVYPGDGDRPWESIRLNALREAMEDMRLLQLCEKTCGREAVLQTVRELAGGEVSFTSYPTSAEFLLSLHNRLIEMLG